MPAHQTIRRLFFPSVVLISIFLSAASWIPSNKETILTKHTLQDNFADINPAYEWNTDISTPGYEESDGMVVDKNGDVVVVFDSYDSVDSSSRVYDPSQVYVAKFDKNGNAKWQVELDTNIEKIATEYAIDINEVHSVADTIILDNEGNIYIVGNTHWIATFIAKLDPTGNVIWNKYFDIYAGASGRDFPTDTVTVDNNGNLYLVGDTVDIPDTTDYTQPWKGKLITQLIKVSSTGNLEWTKQFAEFNWGTDDFNQNKYVIKTDHNDFIYIVGDVKASWGKPIKAFSGKRDISIAKFDNEGELLWNTFVGSGMVDESTIGYLDFIQIDNNNDIYVAGQSEKGWGIPISSYSGEKDIYLAKIGSNGDLLWNTFIGGTARDCQPPEFSTSHK